MKVIRDGRALTDMAEDIDTRLSEEQKAAARRIICAHAAGSTLAEMVADAEELMFALGCHPAQIDTEDNLLPLVAPINTSRFIS